LLEKVKNKLNWFCNERAHSTCWFDSCCGKDWGVCASGHDRRYLNKRLTRAQADELLYRCVKRKSNVVMASIMWAGVRSFGWYFYKKENDPTAPDISE